jgi:hypothetical protein
VAAATTPTQSAAAAATCGRLSSAAATRVAGLKTLAAAFASSSLFSSRRSWSGGAQGARAPPCVPGSMETSRSGARPQLCPDPDPGQPNLYYVCAVQGLLSRVAQCILRNGRRLQHSETILVRIAFAGCISNKLENTFCCFSSTNLFFFHPPILKFAVKCGMSI